MSPPAGPAPTPRRRRLLVRTVATILPTLVVLLALEGAARWAGVPESRPREGVALSGFFTADPVIGWRLTPGAGLIRTRGPAPGSPPGRPVRDEYSEFISADGFRDDALVHPRPPGQTRVLCLGDSSVFGDGVARNETFPSQLEAALNASATDGKTVEVLNAGVPGYSTWQTLEQLRRIAASETFDGIVVYNMNSDLGAAVAVTDDAWFEFRAPLYRWMWGSAAFRWLNFRVAPPQDLASSLATSPDVSLGARVSPGQYMQNLERLVDFAVERNAWSIFVVPPVSQDVGGPRTPRTWQPYIVEDADTANRVYSALQPMLLGGPLVSRDQYRSAMGLVAWEKGVPIVDAPTLFKAAWADRTDAVRTTDRLLLDQMHPAPEGQRILAAAIKPIIAGRIGIP